MISSIIGENAGKIWKALDENIELTYDQLKEATDLDRIDIFLALGWLSREHKVLFFDFEGENAFKICLTAY